MQDIKDAEAARLSDVLEMTTEIVASFVSNNAVPSSALPDLIKSVHSTIAALTGTESPVEQLPEPAVSINKSVHNDYIVCLEDGRKLKMLKRYLRSRYNMTPEDYRTRWSLPADYPMVAPNYAKRRSDFAKEIGLGRKRTKVES